MWGRNSDMSTIVQREDPVLRQIAQAVAPQEIASPRIKKIIRDMRNTLEKEEDGVALAAPQIGVSLRIFVVSPRVFSYDKAPDASPPSATKDPARDQALVFINPKIIKMARRKVWMEEGCLSVRWLYGNVQRADRATVEALDADGKLFTRGAGGLLAQIFQHEIDHLDGKLFIDVAKNIQEIPPEKIRKNA